MWYLENSSILDRSQCGFRKHLCTIHHLVSLERYVQDTPTWKQSITYTTSCTCPCPVPVRPDFWTSNSSTSCIFYLSTCSSACTIPVCRRVRYGRSSFSDCWWVMLHPSWPRVSLFNRIWTPTSRGRDGRSRLHQLRDSSASSSSSRSPSPLSKPLRADSHSPVCRSCSQNDRWSSPGSHRHCVSPSHASCCSRSSTSHSQRRRSRDGSALSRRPSPAGMTRRLARNVSLSPRRRSPLHQAQRSSWGRCTSPCTRQMSPNRCSRYSSSRSPTIRPRRRQCSRSRSPCSRSSVWDGQRRLHEADQRLLWLHDASPVPPQDDDLEADQNLSVDDSQLSAGAVKKLFNDLLCPPALSHNADPYPATDPTNTQLVPYNKDAAKAPTTCDNKLDTHDGLFKNYKSFHRLSGDQDGEARTSTYHELINLMLSQTSEDKHVINVTAARPKRDGPFGSNLEAQPELKKKQDKLHLQWPPIKETQCIMNGTLGLYQHGQQPKASSSSYQWPPPTVENPWNKEFSPKDFPTAHKNPSTLPKRWELHEDSPLKLKPPTSTAVAEATNLHCCGSSSRCRDRKMFILAGSICHTICTFCYHLIYVSGRGIQLQAGHHLLALLRGERLSSLRTS